MQTITYSHQVRPDNGHNLPFERMTIPCVITHHLPCWSITWDTWSAKAGDIQGPNEDSPEEALWQLSYKLMSASRDAFEAVGA
jgi:hypothetical protein